MDSRSKYLLIIYQICGGFPPCILPQIKNPWFVQGKQMIRLRPICLNQNKFRIVQEERDFLLFEFHTEWIDQTNWNFQTDQPTQSEIPGIEQMDNHNQCLSNGLDDIRA